MTYEEKELSLEAVNWVHHIQSVGFTVYLVSNNMSKERIQIVAEQLNIPGVYLACKPFSFGIRALIRKYEVLPFQAIIVGDQLLKDVFLGNFLGMYSILVNPLDIKKSIFKMIQRDFELFILKYFSKHRIGM